MTRQSGAIIGLTAIVSFLLGLVAAGTRLPPAAGGVALRPPAGAPLALTTSAPTASASTGTMPAGPAVDFASVAAQVDAAVVNVDAASRGSDRPRPSHGYAADDTGGPHEGSGSGFIIDRSGYILTNQHVISGADRVTVTLADGRSFRAAVIGADPAIDVALLKVHSRDSLPVAPLGNSNTLRVGEWVCAIGNPLGVYVHSVTVGVVSFLGRKLFDQGLDAYIQTDAAISFGSSGGPLVNARGEVVGITTAISAQAMNIGFAIPISQVTGVLNQLREQGSVTRGTLGVGLANLTPELQRALRLQPDHGAVIQDVSRDSPAERAGLRTYDVVTAVDGQRVQSDDELLRSISARVPGTVATLEVWRDGVSRRVDIKLAVREVTDIGMRPARRGPDLRPVSQDQMPLGLNVRDLDADVAAHLHIPESLEGVLVSDVDTAGPAHRAQIRASNVIVEINRRPVHSAAQFRSIVTGLKPGDPVALLVFDRTTAKRSILTVLTDPEP